MEPSRFVRPKAWLLASAAALAMSVVAVPEALVWAAAPPREEITEHYTRMLRYHRRMDDQVPDGSVVFLGDSLTQGFCTDAVAQPSVNYGIGSDTTVGVLGRLATYSSSLNRAAAVILAIGVNDFLFRDNREIAENYRRILERLPAGTPVVSSALLPINERSYPRGTPVNNARIAELNALLRDVCASFPRCVFVDARPRLVDAEGNLQAELEDGDGIHLNAAGNRIWSDVLRAGLRQARGSSMSLESSPSPQAPQPKDD